MATGASTSSSVFAFSVKNVTTTYSASIGQTVRCDTSGGGFTVTLPSASGCTGQRIQVKKISTDANNITVNTTSSQTIDGLTTQIWSSQYDTMEVESNGTNWDIV